MPSRPPKLNRARSPRRDQRSTAAEAYRAWYKTARWQKLRYSVLVRDTFTCQQCGRLEGDSAKLVADHKTPHKGDPALFWDDANLQCICKPCHDRHKQRAERGSPTRDVGPDGWPKE